MIRLWLLPAAFALINLVGYLIIRVGHREEAETAEIRWWLFDLWAFVLWGHFNAWVTP